MISSTLVSTLLAFTSVAIAAPRGLDADRSSLKLRDEKPLFAFDANTIKTCTWWYDNDGTIPCAAMPGEWGITLENFLKWVGSL